MVDSHSSSFFCSMFNPAGNCRVIYAVFRVKMDWLVNFCDCLLSYALSCMLVPYKEIQQVEVRRLWWPNLLTSVVNPSVSKFIIYIYILHDVCIEILNLSSFWTYYHVLKGTSVWQLILKRIGVNVICRIFLGDREFSELVSNDMKLHIDKRFWN